MIIFREMHEKRQFESLREFTELQRMLSEAISHGYVEEVPVMRKPGQVPSVENWYRDSETGEIYRLSPPNPPSKGSWARVEIHELRKADESIQ